jgi:bifunctional UDP-N-acetylglucosamine pyrophosphorylase / glucosamine-1-phosphate N-acetyltransferase
LNLEIVILAAGQGKRMYSRLPKVLHDLAGKPLLGHVFDAARSLAPRAIHVVYGHGGDQVRAAFTGQSVNWALQAEQKGTGHALAQALPAIADDATVLVLYGDVPLIRSETLRTLADAAGPQALALLTATLPEPGAYGRIVRDVAGKVVRIVEAKDASPSEIAVREINTGFLAAPAARLKDWVARLRNHNAQGEYYLTDVIAMAVAEGLTVTTPQASAEWEILGVNSKTELAQLERTHQLNQAQALLKQGVTLRDPARFDLRGELVCGNDVVIDVNVVIEGKVTLGDGVKIGPNNVLRNVILGKGTEVQPNCVLEEAIIGRDCRIGPFARVRPETQIADHVHVGNFVEIKKSVIGEGSKVNHLTYVGDSSVGRNVNVGAGTITCNYDGANKHRTVIGDNVFIGSNAALVAPLTIGAGATIGAGSVIAREAPAGELTLTRAEQRTIKGWKRPVKAEKREKKKEES